MKNCLNCYNGFVCKKREKAKQNPIEYDKLLDEGCPQWEDDSYDWDNDSI